METPKNLVSFMQYILKELLLKQKHKGEIYFIYFFCIFSCRAASAKVQDLPADNNW